MDVTFHKPVLLSEKGCHSFTLIDVPVFECVGERSKISIDFSKDCSGQLLEFASSFLLKASKYFSKQLPVSTFLGMLGHRWNTTEFLPEELEFEDQALLKWIPATVLFYKGFYELEWDLVEIVPLPPPIKREESELQPEVVEQPLKEAEEAEEAEEAGATDIPSSTLEESDIPPTEPLAETSVKSDTHTLRDAYKQKVRKARLRAVLAQLRAEKLAEQYYLRYGNLDLEDGDGSDSELSFQDGYT